MEPNKRPPGILPLAIILVVFAFGCVGSILVAADIQCNSDIKAWAPLYPNGETVSVQYDFVHARGLGSTTWIQTSTDDIEAIKQFYRDNTIAMLNSQKTRGLAATDWHVEPDEETGTNRIILTSSCGI